MCENGTETDEDTQQELCLIKPSANSTLHIQSLFLREELKFTAVWKMGLKIIF